MGDSAAAKVGTFARDVAKVGAEVSDLIKGAAKLGERLEALQNAVKAALKEAHINAKVWAKAKLDGISDAIEDVKGLFEPEAVTTNGLPMGTR